MRDADARIASNSGGGGVADQGRGVASKADAVRAEHVPSVAWKLPSDQDASGRTLGAEEVAALRAVVESGTLTSTKGSYVKGLEAAFAGLLGIPHAIACSSGTAAVHTAIAAINPEPGDEIVTTSITDMGALAPILYQGAIPVFADVDPNTGNVTANTIRDACSDRTRAMIATHLFGESCEMDAIVALGAEHDIPVIEDCAQAFLAMSQRRPVGTMGSFGCFSTQQGKHITSGEGGLVVTADADLARYARRYVNKAWDYDAPQTDHDFLALNYRMTELQGAVLGAQIEKLNGGVQQRIACARHLNERLAGVPGLLTPEPLAGDTHVYWRYALMVDPAEIPGGPTALAAELKLGGIASGPRYIQKPAFRCGVFANQRTFGESRFPFTLARPEAVDYDADRFPGTFQYLDRVLVLPWNERYTIDDVDRIADALVAAVSTLRKGQS
ncbi:MAG: DegT/DnrJ/EryC1/StrS aminotransferase [Actinomycetia bacterium]|nr:DegT/DnrJ/EryC1/StrS aminotransferase [Actinomycetes bacterium]